MALFAVLFVSGISVASAQVQCTSLPSDVSYGMMDGSANGTVMLLQRYLSGAGYLSATSTGYFGAATLSAVKSFQVARGISNTGYVGPATRAAINSLSCSGNASAVGAQAPSTVVPVNSTVSSSVITGPSGGQTLITGHAFNITWNSQPYSRYNLVLISSSGAGAGFIASSLANESQYLWTVGNVFSSQTQSNIVVPAGSYQIRMENATTGAEPTDPISDPFTISAATLNLSYVFPTSAPSDGNTAVVLYGSDFNSYDRINFSGSNGQGQILYASPDGRVLVFSIPANTLAGSQSVYVSSSNSSNQSSNELPFNITSQ